MAKKEKQIMIRSFPFCTLFIVLLSISSYIFSELASCFIYNRNAILNGEIWRLLTGHLVHFNMQHQVYNLIVFGLIGGMIESKKRSYFILFCLLAAVSISIFLLIAKTEMAVYGGLSGLACGLLIYFALAGLNDNGSFRSLCWMVLFIIPIKIFFEGYRGESVLPYPSGTPFITIWEAHAIGSSIALLVYIVLNLTSNATSKMT